MALVPVTKKAKNDIARIHDGIDGLISSFFGDMESPFSSRNYWPALDIVDKDEAFIVKAEIPGCKTEDIDISIHGNTLTISGEKKQQEEKEGKGHYHVERSYGSFRRELSLPVDIETENIEATYKNGVLCLTLPKAKSAKPIKVKVNEK